MINPKKWFIVLRTWLLKKLGITYGYAEQVVWRAKQCPDCLEAGYCKHCGCTTPDLFLDRANTCSGGNWGPMFNDKNWEEFKQLTNAR